MSFLLMRSHQGSSVTEHTDQSSNDKFGRLIEINIATSSRKQCVTLLQDSSLTGTKASLKYCNTPAMNFQNAGLPVG